jgi:hypothetical protein
MIGAGHVARTEEMRTIFWLVSLNGRDHVEDLGIDGRIILECIVRKQSGKIWAGFIWLRIGTSGGIL